MPEPFTADDMGRLFQMSRYFEGEKLAAYLDSKGILTIGVGHNCKAHPFTVNVVTQNAASCWRLALPDLQALTTKEHIAGATVFIKLLYII